MTGKDTTKLERRVQALSEALADALVERSMAVEAARQFHALLAGQDPSRWDGDTFERATAMLQQVTGDVVDG